MKKLDSDQAVVISAYTGVQICNISDMHREITKRLGRQVWTHELPRLFGNGEIKAAFRDDFLALLPEGVGSTALPGVRP